MEPRKPTVEAIDAAINNCMKQLGISERPFATKLIHELVFSCLNLYFENHTTAQIKLINHSLKEMRYAYRVFNSIETTHCLSIFGSARTPAHHPDYLAAKEFSSQMASLGWMCITGAAQGIMLAGMEGAKREQSFGLSIRLAFEPTANEMIEGDPKLINFRYFFVRKLMFLTHSDAVAVFPGGVGTMDELFEVLTLMQTGKSPIIPVVLMEGEALNYWTAWENFMRNTLLAAKTISPDDFHLFKICKTVEEGVSEIRQFYHRYHSNRYVNGQFVIRLTEPLSEQQLTLLNQEFASLVLRGKIEQGKALEGEEEFLELPRLSFIFVRRNFGVLRQMINRINSF